MNIIAKISFPYHLATNNMAFFLSLPTGV